MVLAMYLFITIASSRPYFLEKFDDRENENDIKDECQQDTDCLDIDRPKCSLHQAISFYAPNPKEYKMCVQETLCNTVKEISNVNHKY